MKDEPTFSDFQCDRGVLDDYLVELTLRNGRNFQTYEKLRTLEETAIEYFEELSSKIDGFLIAKDDVVIDIGAHHGIVSLYAGVSGARVEAYEPNPLNFSILKRNFALNSDLNLVPFNCAVAVMSGDFLFNFGKTSTTGAMVNAGRDWKRTEDNVRVKGVGINEILLNYENIKLLKVDCEGSEYEIFQNISEVNFSKVEVFYVEVHPTEKHDVSDFEGIMKDRNCPFIAKEVAHGCFEYVCSKLI